VDLPINPPVEPMLATACRRFTAGDDLWPKWDGFRCIIFRDGDEVELAAVAADHAVFSEVVEQARALPVRCAVDGSWSDHRDADAHQARLRAAQ
jgi:ATP-dependent DNA ligase